MNRIAFFLAIVLVVCFAGCDPVPPDTSDSRQQKQQETLLKEATAQTGMPSIVNFRERKIVKEIIELRDQEGLVTYTYLENMVPTVIPGHTVMGGKLTYVGESIGYGIPAATQYTSPQKVELYGRNSAAPYSWQVLPQADPNGLFSPSSAEGSWVMMLDKKSGKALPQYFEPRVVVLTYKPDFDVGK